MKFETDNDDEDASEDEEKLNNDEHGSEIEEIDDGEEDNIDQVSVKRIQKSIKYCSFVRISGFRIGSIRYVLFCFDSLLGVSNTDIFRHIMERKYHQEVRNQLCS